MSEQDAHALVVGGTGMLRRASLYLAERGDAVSVIARSRERLASLVEAAATLPGSVNPLALDYRESERLVEELRGAVAAYGPVGLAVCWIHHEVAPGAFRVIVDTVGAGSPSVRLFHVRGSAVANPASGGPKPPEWMNEYPQVKYRQVILGFVIEGGRSRWLTHEEISGGVIAAIHDDAERFIVGTVEPWSMRP